VKYLIKIPPIFLVPLFYAYVTVGLLLKYMLCTITGVFLSLAAIYLYLKYFGEIRPFSWLELLTWVSYLDKEYKVAILSSLVTIVGFIVAFHTASLNWQSQMRAQLKLQVAGELDEFFAQISQDINLARIHVERLVKTVNKIQEGCDANNIKFDIQYVQQQNTEYLSTRSRLAQNSVTIHRLLGKYSLILSSGWSLIRSFESATNAFKDITDKMWLSVPTADIENPNYINLFLREVDVSKCNEFIQACNDNYSKINGLSGGIRGYLISPIVGFNLFSYLHLLSIRGGIIESMREHFQQSKNNK